MSNRILMTVGSYYIGLPANTDAGVVVAALANGQIYLQDYCANGPTRYKPTDNDSNISVAFVDESLFDARKETEKMLAHDIEQSNKRWLNEYSAHGETKKKLKEVEDRLKAVENATKTAC